MPVSRIQKHPRDRFDRIASSITISQNSAEKTQIQYAEVTNSSKYFIGCGHIDLKKSYRISNSSIKPVQLQIKSQVTQGRKKHMNLMRNWGRKRKKM